MAEGSAERTSQANGGGRLPPACGKSGVLQTAYLRQQYSVAAEGAADGAARGATCLNTPCPGLVEAKEAGQLYHT